MGVRQHHVFEPAGRLDQVLPGPVTKRFCFDTPDQIFAEVRVSKFFKRCINAVFENLWRQNDLKPGAASNVWVYIRRHIEPAFPGCLNRFSSFWHKLTTTRPVSDLQVENLDFSPRFFANLNRFFYRGNNLAALVPHVRRVNPIEWG